MDNNQKNIATAVAPEQNAGNTPNIKPERKRIEMPKRLTVSPSPHIKSPETTTTVMMDVILALVPALVWGVYVFGWRALAITVLSVASAVGFEAAAQKILHRPVTVIDLSAALTGLLIALNLPVSVPLWMPVIGSFFAIVVAKQLFGGIGKNFVNPALAARVFMFSWAGDMTRFTAPGERVNSLAITLADTDIVASATPLASLKTGVLPQSTVLDMIVGDTAGCIGEVSALLLIVGGIYLLARRTITWHIPASFIATVAVLTLVFARATYLLGTSWQEKCSQAVLCLALSIWQQTIPHLPLLPEADSFSARVAVRSQFSSVISEAILKAFPLRSLL